MNTPTQAQLAYAFELQSKLGMTVENRKFHASAQVGHVHYGYCRHKDSPNDVYAQWRAVLDCAESYFSQHPEEKTVNHYAVVVGVV
jgi:hypothetical protein